MLIKLIDLILKLKKI